MFKDIDFVFFNYKKSAAKWSLNGNRVPTLRTRKNGLNVSKVEIIWFDWKNEERGRPAKKC